MPATLCCLKARRSSEIQISISRKCGTRWYISSQENNCAKFAHSQYFAKYSHARDWDNATIINMHGEVTRVNHGMRQDQRRRREPCSHDFVATISDRISGIRFQYNVGANDYIAMIDFQFRRRSLSEQRSLARTLSRRSPQLRDDIDINERTQRSFFAR